MAIDKAVDSQQLDAGLTSIADSIRAKGGTTDALTFPGGFAAAISAIATGGGTLAMKTGTVTLSESYIGFKAEHGCGKLPYAFFAFIADNAYPLVALRNVGLVWHRESFALTIRSDDTKLVGPGEYTYIVPIQEPVDYSIVVDETTATCSPARKWCAATYRWIAIYEV